MHPLRGLLLASSIAATLSLSAQPYTFRHVAGSMGGPGRTDATGTEARFYLPDGITVDGAGNIYVADSANQTIRRVTAAGVVTTLAGMTDQKGFANGFRGSARFDRPLGIAVDAAGNVFVSDNSNTIRKITPAGLVSTFAGRLGSSGHVDGTGTAASFFLIAGLACDAAGNVYVAEYGYHDIRKITPGGVVTTFAGLADNPGSADGTGSDARFNRPSGVAVDGTGNVYVADGVNNTVRKITPAGVVSTLAGSAGVCGSVNGTSTGAQFCGPRSVAVDANGNVYVADGLNGLVRKVTAGGTVTTFAGNNSGQSLDGTSTAASFAGLNRIAIDGAGNLYVTESSGHVIRKITPAAVVTTIAGMATARGSNVATGPDARFSGPEEPVVDANNNVYIADSFNGTIRKIATGSLTPTVFAGTAGSFGTTDGTGAAARFRQPAGLALDSLNNLYVTDVNAQTIRKITPAADVTTFAGGTFAIGSDDGTGTAARFNNPADIAADGLNNLYVADTGNHTIRKITPGGVVTTLAGLAGMSGSVDGTGSAARFNEPVSLIVGSDGNLYVCDRADQTIRKVTMDGIVTTLAGSSGQASFEDGAGSAARFWSPTGIAADGSGNLYVTDGAYTVRKVTLAGVVTTIGGRYSVPGTEDGTGDFARFVGLRGITSTSGGVLYIADEGAIRRGAAALADVATIDTPEGIVGATRQLGTAPMNASIWIWSIVRRPTGSSATLSATNTRTPTFTPDVPDYYTFRLLAAVGATTSVTEVTLHAKSSVTVTVGPPTLPDGVRLLNYAASLSASGGTSPYVFTLVSGTLPGTVTLSDSGALSGYAGNTAGTFNFTIRATDSVGATGERAYAVAVTSTPTGIEAHATGATTVAVTWPAVPGATQYRVFRSSSGTTQGNQLGDVATASFTDTTATAGTAYLYRFAALDDSGHTTFASAPDLATTVMFDDDPIMPGVTPVRAQHMTQLLTAVNAVRSLAQISSYSFTVSPVAGQTVTTAPVTELRSALAAARSALSLPTVAFTDPTISAGTTIIKAAHISELRSAMQ